MTIAPKVLVKRTATDNTPPPPLGPGELGVEMGVPARLWVGTPGGNKLLADPAGALPDAPNNTNAYGRMGAAWHVVLPIEGGTLTGPLTLAGPPSTALHAATKQYVDGAIAGAGGGDMSTAGGQTLTGGFKFVPYNAGNFAFAGFTPNPLLGNYQYGSNIGAFIFNAPTVDCAIDILITNSASAGAITMTGFTVANGNVGDVYLTTSGFKFIISVRRINGVSTYVCKALQ